MRGIALSLLAFALPGLIGPVPAAAQLTPRGPEVAVDPDPGILEDLLVAGSPDGSACIAWDSVVAPRFTNNLFLAVSGATGAISPVITLSRTLSVDVINGLTAIPGGYRLVWTESPYAPKMPKFKMVTLGTDGGIVQHADSLGTAGWQADVDLIPRPHGGYIATWTGPGAFFVELRDEAGYPVGGATRIRLKDASWPRVLHQIDGSFIVVAWRPGLPSSLHGQRFDAQGRPLRGPFRLLLPPHASSGLVVLGQDGTLAVASVRYNGFWGHVTLSTFTSDGLPLGSPVVITRGRPLESIPAALAIDPVGRVLLVWGQGVQVNYLTDKRVQMFTRTGEPLGGAIPLASSASALLPSLDYASADWAGDDWVVAWVASPGAPDSSVDPPQHLYLRRFARQ